MQTKQESQAQDKKDYRGDLKEFSVVYTDRAVNLMSAPFVKVMQDIISELKQVYKAEQTIILPGSGTFGMEAVARQFATGKKCMVLRNGFFSYRWTQIFEFGNIPSESIVLKARPEPNSTEKNPQYIPCPIEEVVNSIKENKPAVVFAPHVETSTGMIIPDDYIKQVSDAVHSVGGIFVLDGIASGVIWVDMEALGIDVYITAPQKGWSSPASSGVVMLSKKGKELLQTTKSSSFAMDLKKWSDVSDKYESGGFMYHCTPPTDGLAAFRDAILETKSVGYDKLKAQAIELAQKVRAALESHGYKAVAAKGFESPGVMVSYASTADMFPKFKSQGIQVAGGVPWFLDEEKNDTFRIGLFGLEKWADVDGTTKNLKDALEKIAKL